MEIYDCIIIGAGPAGITASIYLKKANKNIVLLEKSAPGGQVIKTNIVDNYPGFLHTDGPTLATKMIEHATGLGVNYKYGDVTRIERVDDLYKVITNDSSYLTRKVIIATGRSPKALGLPNEDKLVGHGISYCATCDGFLYKDKIVGVVGAGNSAFEQAIYLSKICKFVYMFNRSDNIRADSSLQDEVSKISNIKIVSNSVVTDLLTNDNRLSKVIINKDTSYDIEGLFIFVGVVPTKFMIDNINIDNDYIVVNKNMATNLHGIYACGDIIKKDFYQISIAVGEGTVAALNVIKELKNENNN